MAKLQLNESLLLLVLLFMPCAKYTVQGFASEAWIYYLGPLVDLIGPINGALIRAMVSHCVPMHELAKALACIGSLESIIPIVFTQIYAVIWKVQKMYSLPSTDIK